MIHTPSGETESNNVECACPECSAFKTDDAKSDLDYWRLCGKFFGYPDCCIEEFLKNASTMTRTTGTRAQTAQHGFVPCENHSREIIAGNNTLANLIKDRLCPLEFGHHVMYDPYATVMLKNFVGAVMYGIPTSIIMEAIKFTHKHTGEQTMNWLKCKEAYEQYEKERSGTATDSPGTSSS